MRMKKTSLILLLASSLLLASQVFPQKKTTKNTCDDARTQLDMNVCADKEFKKADAELNRVYNRYMAGLDDEGKAKLKEAEMAWIKYRDATCESESDIYRGGSMRPMIYSFCLASVTDERTKRIKGMIKDSEQ